MVNLHSKVSEKYERGVKMSVTIRELSKVAGVSPATISRYYSGSEVVSTDTARKIESAAEDVGYKHKYKRNNDNGVIAVLIPDLNITFYSEVLREIIDQVPRYDYRIVIIPTIECSEHYKKFFKEINIVGVVYLDEMIEKDILDYVSSKKIKSVMCGGSSRDSSSEMVHINDMAAAYEGTKYLIGLGHERILFLSDFIKQIDSSFQRYTGCKRALDEIGTDMEEEKLLRVGPVTYESGYRLTKQAIGEKQEFTAIFAFSDEMAVGAISALKDCGFSVPDDISVLGFDDMPIAHKINPRLTTIHQPIKDMVTKTLDVFMDLDEPNNNFEIRLPYYLQLRESCKNINTKES